MLLSACSEPKQPTITFFRAIETANLDQIKRHLYWEADVDQRDAQGNAPIHLVASRGDSAIAAQLIEQGADIAALDAAGRTPLHVALARGKTEVAATLLEAGAADDLQQLMIALAGEGVNDRDTIDLLIARGVDPLARDAAGNTVLHEAVRADNRLVLRRLIHHGADLDVTDGEGRSPLALAKELDADDEIVDMLMRFGATP